MKLICTKCDGLGAIRVPKSRMDPMHNVAQYTHVILSDGSRINDRFGEYAHRRLTGELLAPIASYEKPCTCHDGFVEWMRGCSLTPLIHA